MKQQSNIETVKIYDKEPFLFEFDAVVLSCEEQNGKFATVLDRTAFFPVGGGQPCDTGYIAEHRVFEVFEENGKIIHLTDGEIKLGASVHCLVDREKRMANMVSHGGEHIISALINRKYGLNNVGFHMGSEDITADYDGVLSDSQVKEIEYLANQCVRENRAVRIYYPDENELSSLDYRSKLDLTENVRIVEIDGLDRCACCAPHVETTGQIGYIKITYFIRYKGGIRIHMLCGEDARLYSELQSDICSKICTELSATNETVFESVLRLQGEIKDLKSYSVYLENTVNSLIVEMLDISSQSICIIDSRNDMKALRSLATLCANKTYAPVCIFGGRDGAYRFIICDGDGNAEGLFSALRDKLMLKGGGSGKMICGSAACKEEDIRDICCENKISLIFGAK